MDDRKWPQDYPADILVPPDGAVEIDANLYRLVYKDTPDADDFLASYKDPKQRHLAKKPAIKKKPGFYGASFFDTHDSIKDLVDGNPERFSGQLIATGLVKPEHGKGEPRGHHVSMWFYEGVYPKGFKVV
ncbi:TPA: hypothetical protein ACX6DV_003436 [Vibrio cholerae]